MGKYNPAIEKLAEANLRKWAQAKHVQERLAKKDVARNVGPYLTISRETGAGGSEIARLVGQQLGWDVLDKEIIDYLAAEYGTPRDLVEYFDEKNVGWIENFFTNWIEGRQVGSATYVHRMSHLLLLAAHHGNVVIVGRGADFILPPDRGLSVRILAPVEFRVEQVLLQQGLDAKQARTFVETTDRERQAFVQQHFHHNPSDPHQHDLVINVAKLTQQGAADLIVSAAQFWMKDSGIAL